jgi:hypothetical protein
MKIVSFFNLKKFPFRLGLQNNNEKINMFLMNFSSPPNPDFHL